MDQNVELVKCAVGPMIGQIVMDTKEFICYVQNCNFIGSWYCTCCQYQEVLLYLCSSLRN